MNEPEITKESMLEAFIELFKSLSHLTFNLIKLAGAVAFLVYVWRDLINTIAEKF